MYNCLNDIRYARDYKVSLEKMINSYDTYGKDSGISKEKYKSLCMFVYNTIIDNEGIIKKIKKYGNYEKFFNNQNGFSIFFSNRPDNVEKKLKSKKVYTTYSARGHFQTKNPISAFLNYIAMIPAFLLAMIVAGFGFIIDFLNKKK